MAESLKDLLKKSRSQMNTYKKEELLDILVAADKSDGESNIQSLIDSIAMLTGEISSLRTSLNVHQEATRKQVEDLKEQVLKQSSIISKQQLYLEQLDRKERECNIVLLGVPEDSETLDGATSDHDKVVKVWQAASITCAIQSSKRLGKPGNYQDGTPRRGPRPILIVVNSRNDRDAALDKSKELKTPGNGNYKNIFIKKDVHPSVRAEWKRLHEVVKIEKDRPGNSESVIYLDFKARKVFKDGNLIDQWNMQGF